MTLGNLADLVEAGADIFVAGSLIFGSEDPQKTISDMHKCIKSVREAA